jgi:anti-sigma regulatory factor (Ser/Thr protein kinase)
MTETRAYPNEPASVTRARRFVVDALRGGPPDVVDTAELLVSELATNALRHGGSGFAVTVSTTATQVLVEVTDNGPGLPRKRNPAPLESSGRGLQIVEAIADEWEVSPRQPTGKTVAFRLSLAPGNVWADRSPIT